MGKDYRHRRDLDEREVILHKSGKGSQRRRDTHWEQFEQTFERPDIEADLERFNIEPSQGFSKYQKKKFGT